MSIIGTGQETYLYINGLAISKELRLSKDTVILPVEKPLDPNFMAQTLKNDIDFAVSILCAQNCKAQLNIKADDPEELAVRAWNAQWDILLLDAILNCNAMCNMQSNVSANSISSDSLIHITNYELHGVLQEPYQMTEKDAQWVQTYFGNAKGLLDDHAAFQTAIHSMASYKWHSLPRIQLAVLWSGIEALFGVTSELVFRISLYIANFLSDDIQEARLLFSKVKKLYSARSSAVHGNKMNNESEVVRDSAELLNRLIRKCIENNHMPAPDQLTFQN